ncbi:hypothetical protein LK429_00245 [Hoylesella buccalis]|uniref:hypothetical protein n=1 Tax=Hoylesella buccalis TaxID=28127 RepID=UPI001D13B1C2|nr:hypothetical protein [Hoylesella buccalis]UEA63056.1 hypothetical protein LK429_00245 [Hoylesella buccalis]UWP49654.1 hypothetical protein NQ518_00870 [Hoylesella buccalis ATCC 35310]
MASNNILKFTVAIEDKATNGLDAISNRLKQLEDQFIKSIGNINQSLGNIGGKQPLPNLDALLKQVASAKESLKKDVNDVPMFKNVMEQMRQLQSFVGSSALPQEIKKMEESLSNLFKEAGRVNPNSFTTYFNQLSKAYESFQSKLSGSGSTAGLKALDEKMSSLGGLRGGGITQDVQSQAEQIKIVLLKSIQDINEAVLTTKKLLSNSGGIDFGAVSEKVDRLSASIGQLTEAFRSMNGVMGQDKGLLNLAAGMGTMLNEVKSAVGTLKMGDANLNVKSSFETAVKSIYQARTELERLSPLLEKLQHQRFLAKSFGFDTNEIDNAIYKLNLLRGKLNNIANGNTGLLVSNAYPGGAEGLLTSQLMQAERSNLQAIRNTLAVQTEANSQAAKNEQAKDAVSRANARLTEEEQRVANAIRNSSGAMHGQSQVVSDLKSMALQYLSVWGAQQFVTDMANITGELELQRKSLEVILDNASAAQKMYSEIRDLSQMSPYTFEDLLKSHRQLAAFGIEAKDIFSTLKSLSDIGAGLDVDVSRLILAFGHTKSYGYLSGIQNRQFETAGIDLVGALSAMYNRRANERKREGKQYEFVNRKDIFQRMRARSIPFEDVQEVILDLDKPGGKFYNMQIRQFETLGGKLRNLRNNYRIMMSELGGANKGFLMGSVGMINELTEHWQRYLGVLKGVAFGYGAIKLASLFAGRQALSASKELVSASVLRNRLSGTTSYLNGNISMWGAMGSSRNFFSHKSSLALDKNDNIVRSIATDTKLNSLTKQRIALTSALTKEQRILLLTESGINQARATQIASMSAWRRGLLSLRLGIIGVAQSFKAMALAMLTNPMTWIFAAVGAVTWIVNKIGQGVEEAENFKKGLSEAAETDVKGMSEFLDPYKQSGMIKTVGKTSVRGDGRTAIHETVAINKAELEAEGIDTVFEELKNRLQTASPMYEGDYFDVMKAGNQAEQVEGLFQKMEDIKFAKQIEQQTSDELGAAVSSTAPESAWYVWQYGRGEGVITNMGDYAKDRADLVNSIRVSDDQWNSFSQEDRAAIEKYMRDLGMARNEAIAKYLINMSAEGNAKLAVNKSYDEDNVLRKGAKQALKLKHTLDEAKADIAPVAESMATILVNKFGDNISAGSAYVTDAFDKMLSDAKVGSPETQAELAAELNRSIYDNLASMGKSSLANMVLERSYQNEIGKMALSGLDGNLRQDMSEDEVIKVAKGTAKKALEALKLKDPKFNEWWKSQGKTALSSFLSGITEKTEHAAKNIVSNIGWVNFYQKFGLAVTAEDSNDYIGYIKNKRKEIADNMQRILSVKSKLKTQFKIDVGVDLNSSDAVKQIARLVGAMNRAISDAWKTHNASSGEARKESMRNIEFLRTTRDNALTAYKVAHALQADHQSLTDDDGKNKGGRGSRSSHSGGSYKDPFVNRWDERIRVMKEANNVYEDWEKRVGRGAAIERVNKQFGDIFESWKKDKTLPFDFNTEDVGDIRKYVESIKQQAVERYKKQKGSKRYNHGEESLRVYRQAQEVLNSIDAKMFDRATELWASKTNLWLDRLTKKWELYQKVLKATGDMQLSMSLSGFNTEKYQSVADAIKEKISKDLQDMGVKKGFVFDKDASDKQIEESVKASLGGKSNDERIKGIVEELKKWRDLQRQIEDEGKEAYASIVGGIDNYLNRIQKANSEYEDLLRKMENAKNAGALSEEQFQRGVQIAADKRDRAIYEASAPYKQLIGSTLTNSSQFAHAEGNRAIQLLMEQFNRGSISADEYTKKIKEINDALDKTDKSKVSDIIRFFNETPEQRHTRKANEAMERFTNATNEYEQYKGIRDKAIANGDKRTAINAEVAMGRAQAKQKAALAEANEEQEKAIKFKKFADAVDTATKALRDFQSGMDLLSKTFSALGMEGAANVAEDAAGLAGGMLQGASSLSFLGPWGQAAGAALGLIGGVAQLHDKNLERQIGKIKDDVANIEAYTEVISRAQERTLGYDRGNELRSFAQQYAKKEFIFGPFNFNKDGAAGHAMKEFYGAATGADNGYQQQFELLKRERQDYVDMYNKEDDKKKKSQKDLLEYKKKIAELDDKTLHFVEDAAKNLWGIDIKGWADQVSDALCNAFENGEDAAKAFKDTTEDILRGVANNIIKMGIIQPMFEELRTKLLGYNDKAGNYHAGLIDIHDKNSFKDPDKTAKVLAGGVGQFMKERGNDMITTAQQGLIGMERMFESMGYSLKKSKDSGSGTLSSGIQGMSEDTAGLLAGYVNALRQDVSYIRLIQTTFANEMWKDYIQQVTGMGGALTRIDENVAAIRSVISENGALYQKVEQMAGDLHNVIFGNERVRIE